ncbi:MAG TPA: DUF1501 domain-containing protein, partial [Verrucomicrobiota bacterium]|nr:DUF1501 domain-containing protein [Verrucomicrobiota bacterium]
MSFNLFSTRRDFLSRAWNGIGAMALGGVTMDDLCAGVNHADPFSARSTHFPRKAKNCIFLFMQGGVSQMDSFEYKPKLRELHGKPLSRIPNISGELQGRLSFPHVTIGSPFEFAQHGQSGRWLSDRFPHLARHVDDLAFIHGIKTDNQNHGPSTLHVTTGSQFPGSPSVGSWVGYGLGSGNRNMPGYMVIQDPRGAPVNGAAVWSNGYLPAAYQGTLLRPSGMPILNLDSPKGVDRIRQRREMDALQWLNKRHLAKRVDNSELEARISTYELAFRMQTEAPELVDISDEPKNVRDLYGLDNSTTAGFGHQCLLARRMVESGVRYTLLVHGVQIGSSSWDDHGNVKGGMIRHCAEVDQPVSGLLEDLKQRGLLDETLVVWASEMGRTPFKNGGMSENPGLEHNSWALTMWMAGGNVKGGTTAGQTDEFSLRGMGEMIHMRDVHATILDQMGLDQQRWTYLHAGLDRKLTGIGGAVLDR